MAAAINEKLWFILVLLASNYQSKYQVLVNALVINFNETEFSRKSSTQNNKNDLRMGDPMKKE